MSKLTSGILIFFGLYFAYTANVIYTLFYPPKCVGGDRNCVGPAFKGKNLQNLKVCVSEMFQTLGFDIPKDV